MTTFYALKRKTTGTMEPTLYKRSEAARAKADQNGLYEVVPLYDTTPARAEAQDEGAAGELKPCPFCGGEAEIIHLDDDDNAGGSCVCCTKCQASGNVEFGRKENFVENLSLIHI